MPAPKRKAPPPPEAPEGTNGEAIAGCVIAFLAAVILVLLAILGLVAE